MLAGMVTSYIYVPQIPGFVKSPVLGSQQTVMQSQFPGCVQRVERAFKKQMLELSWFKCSLEVLLSLSWTPPLEHWYLRSQWCVPVESAECFVGDC